MIKHLLRQQKSEIKPSPVMKPPALPTQVSKKTIDPLGETFGKRSSATINNGEQSFRAHTSIGTNASNTSRMSTMMATLQPKKD